MRKEILFAIVVGTVFGLIVAFGVIRANNAITHTNTAISTSNDPVVPSPTPGAMVMSISLTKPLDKSVETESPITISGISKPQSYVVITLNGDDYITKTNDIGEFNENIKLSGGLNPINIIAINENGEVSEKSTEIIYSTEFSTKKTDSESEDPEKSEDDIEERVNQKIEDALNKATFYSGTITDITNSTLQLKSDGGEIKQVSIDDNATFVKLGKTQTTLKFPDLAIGDYILALGYVSNKDVLSSSRILVTSPYQQEDKVIILGIVTDTSKNQIIVTSQSDQKQTDITVTNNTITTSGDIENPKRVKFSSITDDDVVLVIGQQKDSTVEAVRVQILPSDESN